MSDNNDGFLKEEDVIFLKGSVYHTDSWKNLISRTYGYSPKYLLEYRKGFLEGIIPIFKVNSIFRGTHLSGIPFSHQVNPLYKDKGVLSKLITQAKDLCSQNNCKYVEIRGGGQVLENYGFKISIQNYVSILPLTLSKDQLWRSINSSTKRNINRASKSGLIVERRKGISDYYAFSKLILETRRYQGSLPYPRKLYEELYKNPYSRLYSCYLEDLLVAGIVLLTFGKKVIYAYGSSIKNQRILKLRPNDFLFWTVINQVRKEGFELFDFGTTPLHNVNLLRFKENWGAKSQELPYAYWLNGDIDLPIIQRNGTSVKVVQKIIQKMPLRILSILGPVLLREMG